jgi:hypothetical protein
MYETTENLVGQLRDKINNYGKENLEEMLLRSRESASNGLRGVKFYEVLPWRFPVFASGPFTSSLKEVTFPIISDDAMVSRTFVTQIPQHIRDTKTHKLSLDQDLISRFNIAATYLLPIASQGRSIGVICLDKETKGEVAAGLSKAQLSEFIAMIADSLDHARKYHQQILLARRVAEYKKREAAAFMVKSAVQLIDRIALASVLVPVTGFNGK